MLFLLLACAPKSSTEVATPAAILPPDQAAMVTVHMSQNFTKATDAKDSVVLGIPDQARTDLRWLGEQLATDALGEPGRPYLTALKLAAKEASDSTTTDRKSVV